MFLYPEYYRAISRNYFKRPKRVYEAFSVPFLLKTNYGAAHIIIPNVR
jgi:hypothetical protein